MVVKDISFSTPQENILYDEVLLHLAEKSQSDEVLRFWESEEYFIVLGRIGKAKDDINMDAVKTDNILVLRRASGGGTVVQGKGCLNFSLILSKEKNPQIQALHKSNQFILGNILTGLGEIGVKGVFRPTSDLAFADNERKFSGNAQKRGKHFILHHGTLLYDFDLAVIEKYLRTPKDMPVYRRERPHRQFVTNITVPVSEIKKALHSVFPATRREDVVTPAEKNCLTEYLKKDIRVPIE